MADPGLDEVLRRLDLHEGLLKTIITKVEARIPSVDDLEAKIRRTERIAGSLTDVSLKLAAAKALSSWIPGAVAGAVAGALVLWAFLGSHVALAH